MGNDLSSGNVEAQFLTACSLEDTETVKTILRQVVNEDILLSGFLKAYKNGDGSQEICLYLLTSSRFLFVVSKVVKSLAYNWQILNRWVCENDNFDPLVKNLFVGALLKELVVRGLEDDVVKLCMYGLENNAMTTSHLKSAAYLAGQRENKELVWFFVNAAPKNNDILDDALCGAADENNLRYMTELRKKGAGKLQDAFESACEHGSLEAAKLLDKWHQELFTRGSCCDPNWALAKVIRGAVFPRQMETIRYLLDKGATHIGCDFIWQTSEPVLLQCREEKEKIDLVKLGIPVEVVTYLDTLNQMIKDKSIWLSSYRKRNETSLYPIVVNKKM